MSNGPVSWEHVIALSGVAVWTIAATSPWRNKSWICCQLWRMVALLVVMGTTGVICLELRFGYPLEWKTVAFAAFPSLTLLWSYGAAAITKHPDTLQALYPWQCAAGERVILFYPKGKGHNEADAIVCGCERTVQQIETLFQVDPIHVKISLFLFPSQIFFEKALHIEGRPIIGLALDNRISLVYSPWPLLADSIAHEMTHIVREHRVTKYPIALLEEGLAMYVEEEITPCRKPLRSILLPVSLRILANNETFFEYLSVANTSSQTYIHAYLWTRFLIQKAGLQTFLRLHREAAESDISDPTECLAKAVLRIYGTTLQDLEESWRREIDQPMRPN